MATISIEVKELDLIGFPLGGGHLYLVFRDDGGAESVIRGGPTTTNPFDWGDIFVQAGVPIAQSFDARGSQTPADRAARELDLGGRDAGDVWNIMLQHVQDIGASGLDYELFNQNSNSTVSSILSVVGFTPSATMPTTDLILPGNTNLLTFDYTLDGTASADIIRGFNGNDIFTGNDGGDTLEGRGGNDAILGDGGNDTIKGGSGNDSLLGGIGDDVIGGASGNDALLGDAGADTLNGGSGDDLVLGGSGGDLVVGETGNDILLGEEGDDRIRGNAGIDILWGMEGSDTMFGGSGVDVFMFGFVENAGADTISDIGTDDMILLANSNFGIVIGDGQRTIDFGGGNTLTVLGDFDITSIIEIEIA